MLLHAIDAHCTVSPSGLGSENVPTFSRLSDDINQGDC